MPCLPLETCFAAVDGAMLLLAGGQVGAEARESA